MKYLPSIWSRIFPPVYTNTQRYTTP